MKIEVRRWYVNVQIRKKKQGILRSIFYKVG